MKSYLTFTILIWVVFLSKFAFSQTSLKGTVKDSLNNPVAGAQISLLNLKDNTILRITSTDSAGNFFMRYSNGRYLLLAHKLGFKTKATTIILSADSSSNKQYEIKLNADIKSLTEVSVKADKALYEQKIDRIIINVQQNAITSNGTVLEALENSPGVDLDKQKYTISLNGKSGVMIMLNGKVSYQPVDAIIRMLNSMSANNIQKIELISNPPAEFESQGYGGIINIVYAKSKKDGFNGNYSINAGYGAREKAGANFDIYYKTKSYDLYSSVEYARDNTVQTFTNERMLKVSDNLNKRLITSHRNPISNNVNFLFGLDLTPDSVTTVGFSASGYANFWHMAAQNNVLVYDNSNVTSSIGISNSEKNDWKNVTADFFVNRKLTARSELNLDFNYLYYHNSDPTNYLSNFFDANGNPTNQEEMLINKVTPVKIMVVKADYLTELNPKIKWKSGFKSSFSSLTNSVNANTIIDGISKIDSSLSNRLPFREDIAAIYSEFNIDLNKTNQLNLGLRYEYNDNKIDTGANQTPIRRNSGNFFPSLFFNHHLSPNSSIQFSYGRRISRPSYNDLAPYVIFLDPTTYFYGNVALKPSISSTYKIDYILSKYLFSFQYSHADNAINSYQATLNPVTNQEIITSVNLKYLNTYSIMLSLPLRVDNWWQMQVNLLGARQELQTQTLTNNVYLSQNYIKVNNTQSFKLSETSSLTLSGVYYSKRLAGMSESLPRGLLNLGFQKKLGNDIIRISYSDILSSNTEKDYTNIPADNIAIREIYKFESRTLRLSFSHKFGKLTKSRNVRETGAEDIKGRVN